MTQTTVSFLDDSEDEISVSVAASAEIDSWIVAPGGAIIDADTIEGLGGFFVEGEGADPSETLFLLPLSTPGFHYLYTFPSQGPGVYVVHLQADPGITEDVAVVVDLHGDSPVRANLFATETTVIVGSPVVVVAAVFEDDLPVPGATVVAYVKPPVAAEFNVPLLDNGQDADTAVGDGLYSGYFVTAEVGSYTIVGDISGQCGGISFGRMGATEVRVVLPSASFTAAPFVVYGEDDNANGLYERLVVEREIDVVAAGEYVLHVLLNTAADRTLIAYGLTQLSVETQVMRATVDAETIRDNGEPGPYTIAYASLDRLAPEGDFPGDLLEGGEQQTAAYQLNDFERDALILTGVVSEFLQDTDQDGKFNFLYGSIQLEVLYAGEYQYSLDLRGGCGTIETKYGQQSLAAGLDDLEFSFNGSLIGASEMDGPYELWSLALFNADASLLKSSVGFTQAYDASIFEGYNGFLPDCNANGTPDSCELGLTSLTDHVSPVLGYVDISATGAALSIGENQSAVITMPFTNAMFPEAQVHVSDNGGIGFGVVGGSELGPNNQPVPSSTVFGGARALLPYWDDLQAYTGGVFWQVVGVIPNRTLIVEWKNRDHYPGDGAVDGDEITFEVQVFETPVDGVWAQFLYADTDFGDPALNDGASATIAWQVSESEGTEWTFLQPALVVPGLNFSLFDGGGTSFDINRNGVPDECDPCVDNACFDPDVCTFGFCGEGDCEFEPRGAYGNVDGLCAGPEAVDIFDILCVLDGFAGVFTTCTMSNVDITPCLPDGLVDIFDILAVLEAFAGVDPCGCTGACPGAKVASADMGDGATRVPVTTGIESFKDRASAAEPAQPIARRAKVVESDTTVAIVPRANRVNAGETVSIDIFAEDVKNLRAYQLRLTGTDAVPIGVYVDTERADYVFAGADARHAEDLQNHRLVVALVQGGVTRPGRVYLGTFVFKADDSAEDGILAAIHPNDGLILVNPTGAVLDVATPSAAAVTVE